MNYFIKQLSIRLLRKLADVRQQQGASAPSADGPGAYRRVGEEASIDATPLMPTTVRVSKAVS